MKNYIMMVTATVYVLTLMLGCGREPQLRIAAASDLRPVMPALVAAFESENPGVQIEVVFGASGSFVAQIASGAPFDVFMSADEQYPMALVTGGRARTLTTYAHGSLMLFVHSSASTNLEASGGFCAALLAAEIRTVAIADPRIAPYGRAALSAIKSCANAPHIEMKLVYGDNVSHTAQLGQTGAAQAAIVSGSMAQIAALRAAGVFISIPATSYPPITQAAVVVTGPEGTPNQSMHSSGDTWVAFLTSPRVQKIFAAHGFEPLE
jgi:molybdate transport system substrate-binding protein